MKALSIKQPWASLILTRPEHPRYGIGKNGIKPVENRKRPWKHNGPLAIHASKSFDEAGFKWIVMNRIARDISIAKESRNLTGGFVGSVNMVDCVTSHNSNYFFGPYGYVFEDPKKCELIPWKGQQGVFNIDIGSLALFALSWNFREYYDCTDCGNLHKEYPKNSECPVCGSVILPF